jgi:hypothetical protein
MNAEHLIVEPEPLISKMTMVIKDTNNNNKVEE